MAKIAWTDEALRWLEDIFEFIAADDSDAAGRTVESIFERAALLSRYPELGHRFLHSARNVRILHHDQYRIAYLIKEDGDVEILGVFHSALDITRYQL
jgi:toxin ParE1/3/4